MVREKSTSIVCLVLCVILTAALWTLPAAGETIRVPQDKATVQKAIDAASDGDTVLVSPGTYKGGVTIEGKTITLASLYLTTKDKQYIEKTILDGEREKDPGVHVILVKDDVGADTKIIGFTIQNGDDGIRCEGNIYIQHNRFYNNDDAIDYQGGGGVCSDNVFEENEDDPIDLDGPCAGVFERNLMLNNEGDGLEIRLQPYNGPRLDVVIRDNVIMGGPEDGIQLVGYDEPTNRVFRIERNLIVNKGQAAIGCMDSHMSSEDYRAASIRERVYVINNTLVNNNYGITGGDNFVVLNNIITGTTNVAMLRVDGKSIAANNLLWANSTDIVNSNVVKGTILFEDPKLDSDHKLTAQSPCIDAGTALLAWDGEVLALSKSLYSGSAPDVGAFELEKKKEGS